ncbi:MAG: SurA N-terminal domain-containing protein [Nanoarchaeota archaeon]|mgnify:CR=1 FL=1
MKKKAPKSSKKDKALKDTKENIAIALAFIVFLAVLVALFYYNSFPKLGKDAVAEVDGKEITKEELDWWYTTSVLPDYRDAVTKKNFLEDSLIPQEILLQEAAKQNIEITEEEAEKALGVHIIENGLTLEDFEKHLNSRGIALSDIKNSFKIRAAIAKLLEKEGIGYGNGESDEDNKDFQEHVSKLINNSDIRIFDENIGKVVLKSFEATGEEICGEKPVFMLFTTTKCQLCNETAAIFKDIIKKSAEEGTISAEHWILDTGDNALTAEKESGISKKELELFKKYSRDLSVPTIIAACKYKRVGSLNKEMEYELKSIIREIEGG